MIVSRKLAVSFAVLLSSAALSAPAFAGDAAAAEALFAEAKKLANAGNFAAACPQFEESQRLDPGMGTLYNLGDCYEKTGRVASAWAAFLDVAAQAKSAGQAARESDARARAAALEPKLSRLTIAVEGPAAAVAGLEVKRGNVVVGKAQWGLSVPVDPGEQSVEVTAPGKKPFSGKVQIPPNGGNVRFAVPPLEDALVAAQPSAPSGAPVSSPMESSRVAPPEEDKGGGSGQRTLGVVVAGVGIVGLAVGTVFGIKSMGKKSDADGHCDGSNACDQEGVTLRQDAISAGNLSTILFAIGGAATIGGVVLFATAPKTPKRASPTLGFAPALMRNGAGLSMRGGFQ